MKTRLSPGIILELLDDLGDDILDGLYGGVTVDSIFRRDVEGCLLIEVLVFNTKLKTRSKKYEELVLRIQERLIETEGGKVLVDPYMGSKIVAVYTAYA